MIPPYNPDIFQRIYHDVIEIKKIVENYEVEKMEHEWIDVDEIKNGPYPVYARSTNPDKTN